MRRADAVSVYRGFKIEQDFESWSNPGRMLKTRTGYMIRHTKYSETNQVYFPGKYRTLADAKREVDVLMKEGGG